MKIIKFKSPTCEPCKIMAPYFDRLKEKYPDLEVLIVDVTNDPENLATKFRVRGFPTTIILDDEGGVIDYKVIQMTEPQLNKWIEDLL